MKQRIFNLIAALLFTFVGVNAQTLSVSDTHMDAGWSETITVNISDATEMTALQFNLTLPEGVNLGDIKRHQYITLGEAANSHMYSVKSLSSGDLLIVVYNLNLKTFKDGVLMRIPVNTADDLGESAGRIYNVRTSTVDAVSHKCSEATFKVIPKVALIVDKASATLTTGETLRLNAEVWPTNLAVEWTSSDETVATVENGVVTAVAAGTATITAKAGDKEATCVVTVEAAAVEPEPKYYWYVGTTEPTELNGAVANAETDKWVEIGTEMPSYIKVETANKYGYWYVLMPTEFDFCPHNSDGSTDESVLWTSTTSSIPGYTLWSRNDKTLKLGTIFKKLGELPYNANSDYWYLGHIDPTTMTEINPINVNNIFFTEGGSWEELIDPSAMIELIVTPKDWDSESMKSLWYIAMPASSGYTPQDADLWETSTATIAGKDYIVYKSEGKVWELNTAFLPEGYVEEEPVEPEPTPITSIEELNNVTLYYISLPNHKNGLVSWAAAENGLKMKSCADLGVAPDANDTKQQFAFISNDDGATRYLYHAAEKKFVAKDGSLCEYPHDALSFVAGAYEGTFVAHFDDSHYINVGGSSQMAVDSWTTADGGNSAVILPVGGYDPAEALAAFEKELPTVTGITSIDELSNEKLYYVSLPSHTNGLVSWAVNGEALKSSKDLGIISCPGNSFQQFAFINYGGAYYLYHAASKMFVGVDGTLSDTPASTVSFSAGNADGTFVVYFDNGNYINVGGSNQMVINGWNTPDGGNSCVIAPVADFDPAEAIEAIKTTGIESSVLEAQGSQLIYDLTGRRVTHPTKGIYIVGGKKVVIK